MNKDHIINEVRLGNFTIDAYYTYPTGTVHGTYLHEQDRHKPTDEKLANTIDFAFRFAAEKINVSPDNKTALRISISDVSHPIFLSNYDDRLVVCTAINDKRGGEEIEVPKADRKKWKSDNQK